MNFVLEFDVGGKVRGFLRGDDGKDGDFGYGVVGLSVGLGEWIDSEWNGLQCGVVRSCGCVCGWIRNVDGKLFEAGGSWSFLRRLGNFYGSF
jgi:hypothetical protein